MRRIIIILALALLPVLSLAQETQVKVKDPMMPKGMIGIKYGYGISNVYMSQDIETKAAMMPLNVSLTYTTYMDLWDIMPYFGLQFEARYSHEGYDSKYMGQERYTVADLSIVSQFHIDFADKFRVLANIGPYAGYRLKVNRDWDRYDNRFDYGLYGGLGFAVVFKPFEIHLEGNYKFSLSSYYHPFKLSYDYWLFARPNDIIISAGIFFHIF
ncbi:MAG: hypothetical protein J6Z27_01360 [Bacteroidales bacterium]|nr:hypothetical protein [Bacteroidales bacterium]